MELALLAGPECGVMQRYLFLFFENTKLRSGSPNPIAPAACFVGGGTPCSATRETRFRLRRPPCTREPIAHAACASPADRTCPRPIVDCLAASYTRRMVTWKACDRALA